MRAGNLPDLNNPPLLPPKKEQSWVSSLGLAHRVVSQMVVPEELSRCHALWCSGRDEAIQWVLPNTVFLLVSKYKQM